MKKSTIIAIAGMAVMTIGALSCKKDKETTTPTPEPVTMTLYDSLGGTQMVADPANPSQMIEKGRLGIRSVVDSTIFVIAGDPAINGYFTVLLAEVTSGNTSGFQKLEKSLTDFFCVATGAKNFTYTGLNMKDAHDPAKNPRMDGKADNAAFDAFVNDLVIGAKQNKLPDYLIARVGAVVNTTRADVVQR